MSRHACVACLTALILLLTSPAFGEHEGCIHEEPLRPAPAGVRGVDGVDRRNYPPDVQVDYQHLKLDIDMPDPMSRSFSAVETLSFKTFALPIRTLDLNAVDLKIDSITDAAGNPLTFSADDDGVTITFDPPLAPETEASLVIKYTCTQPKQGMIFALPDAGYPKRPLQIHTQGQSESNRYWFVSHDYPNERMTTEVAVTIPAKFKALANGGLVERKELDGGRVRYHYKMARPHVSYLVSLVIGEFDVYTDKWRDIPLEYWVAPGTPEADVRRTFAKTAAMLEFFSKTLGVDYPYEKYSQSVVFLFSAGGMENTSVTTLTEDMVLDERASIDTDRDGLIAHEMGHQWFGDMLTCKTWGHLWLNEGFATYLDWAWGEHDKGREQYEYRVWDTMRSVAQRDDVSADGGLAWPFYNNSGETFGRPVSNPYPKGASVLHMLRQGVGDDPLFWRIIGTYTRRHAWTSVESDDLRRAFDDVTGRSYERFFQQWVYRPGSPSITATYAWNAAKKSATVTFTQTQKIDDKSPAFTADVPVWLVDADGAVTKHLLAMTGRSATLTVPCDREPAQVLIDPTLTLLAKWKLEIPQTMLIATAKSGPTLGSRLNAIATLGARARPEAVAALVDVLNDEKAFYGLRAEAAEALGLVQLPAARDALLAALKPEQLVADHKVRRAVVEAVAKYRHPDVAAVLRRIAARDASYAVEAEATQALGGQSPDDANVDVLLANAKKLAPRDQVRVAAVRALGQLGDPRGLDAALGVAAYGQPFRSRPAGVDAVGEIGKDASVRAKARDALIAMLQDVQDRPRRNVIRALGTLGDAKALPELRKIADGPDEANAKAAQDAIDAITKATGDSAVIRDLRDRIERLERKTSTTQPSARE